MRSIRLILCFIFLSLISEAVTLTKEQKRQLSTCAESYFSALELYSNGQDPNQRSKMMSLVFEDAFFRSNHFNDLNPFLSIGELKAYDRPNTSIGDYLDIIQKKFDLKVTVEFSKKNTIDCIDGQVGVINFDKKVTYKGITITFSEVILISLPPNENDGAGYKISEVLSAEDYKGENNTCSNYIDVSQDKSELNEKSKVAYISFENGDFLNAKNVYEYILSKNPNDSYSKNKIDICRKSLTRIDYFNKANSLFIQKDFETAQYWYQKLLTEYPDDIAIKNIQNRILASKQGRIDENYRSAISKADENFSKSDFNNARFYYDQALQVKNGDSYASSKLEEAKVKDDRYADGEIKRVVQLASQSNKYWGEYFKVLMKYEGYGNHTRLKTKYYYNMVLLLNSYDKSTMDEMNFSRKDCRSYCKIYCKKLNDLYFRETDPNMKDEIRHLLDNVINNNNQN